MLPVLFSFGPISISSFGLFLSLGFLLGTFLIWRLAKGWDLDEEKVLDLILLTSFGGLVGARIYFVLFNLEFFSVDIFRVLLITKYPGLNFWGGILGGFLGLIFFAKKLKLNLWQMGDLASVGLLSGLVLGDLGCLLSGCDVGYFSNAFFGVNLVGVVGKRFPVQLLESLLALWVLYRIWPEAVKFHFHGKILSQILIFLGLIKFITQFFRDSGYLGFLFSALLTLSGIFVYYRTSKAGFVKDIRRLKLLFVGLFTNRQTRKLVIERVRRTCYNSLRSIVSGQKKVWRSRGYLVKKFLRKIHVKPTPKNI
jgi:phosphatidylglycerol---prolipoprotein diacylglyceryl transferase